MPDSQVTFVEFLDFECEGCRAVYPAIEQARAEYWDRVNFVIRYFPLQAHVNAEYGLPGRWKPPPSKEPPGGDVSQDVRRGHNVNNRRTRPTRSSADSLQNSASTWLGAFDTAYADPATVERIPARRRRRCCPGRGTPTFFPSTYPASNPTATRT